MDYQESFVDYLRYEKRSSFHTVTAYKNDLDQFVQFCSGVVGEFDVYKVDAKLVRSWIVSLMEQKLTARSVNRKVTSVKSFFKYLMKMQLIAENPAIQVTLPKIRRKLPFFVEEKNINQLLDNGYFENDFTGLRDQLIVTLFYDTGMRLSELISLKDSSINSKECLIKVLGKRNKERIIPYPGSMNLLLQNYLEKRNEKFGFCPEKLLITEKGKPVYEKLVYRIVKQNLGKVTLLEKKSPHVLRHSYATHLLNNGANLNAIKDLLGHANLAATQVYTHTTFKRVHEIYKQAHPRG